MTLPRTVAEVLSDHVAFEVECIDRMYLNVYVPQLQHAGGLLGYVQRQMGLPVASTAPLARITDRFTAEVRRFAGREHIAWVDFAGQRKDDVMHQHLAAFQAAGRAEGVLLIGRAQEKTRLFRTEKRRDHNGRSYPSIVKTTGMVNHFYFYCVDDDFGPFFLKFCSYFPYNAKLCINGNHWAQRQAAKAGIRFEALDNGFAAVSDPAALQRICDKLGPEQIDALLRKWLARLPHPFTPAPGSRLPLRHLHPAGGILPHPDARQARDRAGVLRPGHPGQSRRRAPRPGQPDLRPAADAQRPPRHPGRFRTRVITSGVTPSLHVDYKHATIKQYHKEGRALRTETTINDTRDFQIGKRLTNLPALREVGFSATRRLLRLERLSHDPITGAGHLAAVTGPVLTDGGTRIPGLPLGQPRSHALLAALLIFRLLPRGFTNRDLRELTAKLRGVPAISTGQMTYDLRRLRSHHLIERIPATHRYQVTAAGLHTAMFLTRVHDRVLPAGLAQLADASPPTALRRAATAYQTAIDDIIRDAGLAA